MKKVIVATSGYYGRAIIRKYMNNKDFFIIGIVDNNKKISGTKFWDYPIFSPDKIREFEFDYIFIAGRDYESISSTLVEGFNVPSKKIIRLSKSHLQISKKNLSKRETDTQKILKLLVEHFTKLNIDYWLDFSGLLAFARNQKMAEFSDVEISLFEQDIEKVLILLDQILPNHVIEKLFSKKDTKLFKSNSVIGMGIYPYLSSSEMSKSIEPANITLVAKKIEGSYCYCLDIFGNIKKYSNKFFLTPNQVEYGSIKLNVPNNYKGYLKQLYGNNWMVPADFWTGSK